MVNSYCLDQILFIYLFVFGSYEELFLSMQCCLDQISFFLAHMKMYSYLCNVFNDISFLTSIRMSGLNFNLGNKEYTHGVVIRFRSRELSFVFSIWLYGTSICWLLYTGIFCRRGLWDICGQLRIQRSTEPNPLITHLCF